MNRSRHASAAAPTRDVWIALGLALLLSTAAGFTLMHVVSQLGLIQEIRTGTKPFQVDKTAPSEVRQGLAFYEAGRRLTSLLRDPSGDIATRNEIRRMLDVTISSQLGRLMLAAIAVRDLEASGAAPETWVNTLQPFLEGLERASFRHMQSELREHLAAAGERAGMSAGSARRLTILLAAHPLGPFLQYFTSSQFRAADALRERGAVGLASAMERPALLLLRDWIVEPGAPALRLLAADLLARRLDSASAGQAATAEPAGLLRQWRIAYREVFDERPAPIPIISANREPEVCPELHGPVERWLTIAAWTLIGGIVAAVGAVLTLWSLWRRPILPPSEAPRNSSNGIRLLAGVLGGVGYVLIGFTWYHLNPQVMHDDWSRDLTSRVGWPRGPLVGLAIAAALLIAVWLVRGGDRWRRLTTVAAGACCGLFAASVAFLLVASSYYVKYDACVAQRLASMEKDPILGSDGKRTARVIDTLRAWTP